MASNEPPFQLIRLLGSGRVGDVWLAQQRTRGGISRLVAVKILKEAWDEDSDVVRRLKDEGQVLALLQHPCIVGFHEIARIDGKLALVTEYVEGVSLEPYGTKGNILPPRVAVDIIARVASALDWALRTPHPSTGRPLNLIHRDIKPPNVQLANQGEVKLLDFGLARTTEIERHAKTRMGEIIGTPGYSSPESLAFQVASPAGDVYSLGCTLFDLLVGEPFFHGLPPGGQAALAYQSKDYGHFLARRLPAVPHPDLRILLEEMLAYSPEARPKAGNVCDACEDELRQMSGPNFPEWNRTRVAKMLPPRPPAAPREPKKKLAPAPAATPVTSNRWLVGLVLVASLGILGCGVSSLVAAIAWIFLS